MEIPAQLLQQYLRVDKRYSINPNEEPFFDMPTSLNLERIEYIPPTPQEIEEQSRQKLLVGFNKTKDALNERYQRIFDNIDEKKQTAQNKAQIQKQKNQSDLQLRIDEISYDMLRRGLSESSIFEELVQKAKDDVSSQDTSIDWVLELTLNELEAERQNTIEQKATALQNLQKNFDAQLAQEIAELTESVAKKIENTIKYNNTQEEKEADYKKSWYSSYIDAKQSHSEMARTLLTVSINEGYDVIRGYIYQDKAIFTKDYYLGFDAQTAYDEILALNSKLVPHLSQQRYNEVLAFFRERL